MTKGIIYPTGQVQYSGYAPMKCYLLDIRNGYITLHHKGGSYWDNAGKHYVAARRETHKLKSLTSIPATNNWHFELAHGEGTTVSTHHPNPSQATRDIMQRFRVGNIKEL